MTSQSTSSLVRWALLVGVCLLAAWPPQAARARGAAASLAMLNAACYAETVAPGSIAALFSSGLTSQEAETAQAVPLPKQLAGLSVKVNGQDAHLYFASAGQINLQVPSGVAPGAATVEVFRGGAGSPVATGMVNVAETAPCVFAIDSSGRGQAAAQNSDYSLNGDFDRFPGARPEASGKFVIIYATGIGRTSPLVGDGEPAPGSQPAIADGPTQVTIGGVQAQVLFSGLAPGLVGLWQINVLLPASLPTSLVTPLSVTLKGRQSLASTLAVANKDEFGSVSGLVVNALSGAPFAGASLSLLPQGGGRARQVTTGGDGRYSFYVILPGNYDLAATAPGFITASQSARVDGGQSITAGPMALTAPLADGQYRAVVAWQGGGQGGGQGGVDLDAHLTGPGASDSRFHVWWNGETDLGNPPAAQFDRDDTSGAGPETITFTPLAGGVYRFSVQNYTRRDYAGDPGLANARVTVYVFRGGQQIAALAAPGGGGTLWKVFEVTGGQFKVINQLSDEPDPSGIKAVF